MSIHWHPTSEIPRRGVPIIMRGPSGYRKPNDVRYEAGYYDDDYRPRAPWLTFSNDNIEDGGPPPDMWCYRADLDATLTTATPQEQP